MLVRFITPAVLLSAALLIASCDTGLPLGPKDCNLTTDATTLEADFTVAYNASQTGDGTISTLTYHTDEGPQHVSAPSLPWSTTVQMSTGSTVQITATGEVTNGSLQVEYMGTHGNLTIGSQDSCSQTVN